MRIADHLTNEQKQQLNKTAPRTKKIRGNPTKERIDWEELMGMHMDRYTRKNGAWRRR